MNMFTPSKAKTVQEYIESVPPERRELVEFLHAFIQKAAPSLKPNFTTNMLGYGLFPYMSSTKKKMMEWPVISLANQKQYISLYVCCVVDGKYLAETHAKELGNVDVGKSCIRFKKLDDVNLDALKKVLKIAEKKPGLQGVGASAKEKKPSQTIQDGDRCTVVGGVHKGKSGVVRDINMSKTGHVTITVVQSNGVRFKTLAKNVTVVSKK